MPDQLFLVEGSPREVPLQKLKRVNKYKQAKEFRNTGKSYIRPNTMSPMPPKQLGERYNGETCTRFGKKCRLFSDEERQLLLNAYLARNIKRESTKQKTTSNEKSRRDKSNYYFLPLKSEQVPVCKVFFMQTLAVTDKSIRTALSKISATGVVEKARRGGRYESVKIRNALLTNGITTHINKFPRVESHYYRKSYKK